MITAFGFIIDMLSEFKQQSKAKTQHIEREQ